MDSGVDGLIPPLQSSPLLFKEMWTSVIYAYMCVCVCVTDVCTYMCVSIEHLIEWRLSFCWFGLGNLFVSNPLCFLLGRMCRCRCEQLNLNSIFSSVSVSLLSSCPLRAVLPCMECWALPQRASRWVCWVSQTRVVCLLLSSVFVFCLNLAL